MSEDGDLSNWMVPGRMVKGPSGAMNLVAGVRRIIVTMDHVDRGGAPKFRRANSLPYTGRNVVDMLITDLPVFERRDRRGPFRLIELADGITADEVAARTEARYEIA